MLNGVVFITTIIMFLGALVNIFRVLDRTYTKVFKFLIWLILFLFLIYLFRIEKMTFGYLDYFIYLASGLLVYLLTRHSFAFSYLQKRNRQLAQLLDLKTHLVVMNFEDEEEDQEENGQINPRLLVNAGAFYDKETNRNYIAFTPPAVTLITKPEQDFLLAHEIAHHYLGHCKGWRKTLREILSGAAAGIVSGALFGLPGIIISLPAGSALFSYFERRDERAADKCAIELLCTAGLDPRGALKFFQTQSLLAQEHKWYIKLFEKLFGSHPLSEERRRYIKELIEEYQS